jgi:hypothetical protein
MRLNKEAVARVERGAELLDQKGPPDWRDKINLDNFDMGDGSRCVIGQVYRGQEAAFFGRYGYGLGRLGLRLEGGGTRGPAWHGFDESSRAGFEALERAWTDYLTRRRQN